VWELFYLQVIRGKKGAFPGLLRMFFTICSWLYGFAVQLRNYFFDAKLRAVRQLDIKVISVGNLSVGGTGKTPFVAFIVQELINRGMKPGIVSRGYKASEVSATNDEYKLLSLLCPDTPHAQNRDRFAAARTLAHQNHCDIIVMDDGFQHRQLKRQLDVVLVDASQPPQLNQLLPRGLLREPLTSLKRADFIFLTRTKTNPEQTAQLRSTLKKIVSERKLGELDFKAQCLIDTKHQELSLEILTQKPFACFCGIGNPAGFFDTVRSLNYQLDPKFTKVFPDHYDYSNSDHAALEEWANHLGVHTLLTTEKDLVKFPNIEGSTVTIYALRIIPQIIEGEMEFLATLQNAIELAS
jgi:tetraacyldisaccharide 4'-kinase